ncbi:MAG: helix-turn-helix domain-containing protein [Lysobacterales bacterium]|jgi:AraC-like DNA-binding protein
MTDLLPLLVGFSLGAAVLLMLALATAYRGLDLPPQSRAAGWVMLLGLAHTQWSHLGMVESAAAMPLTRSYVVVLFLQSLGFYWLLLGLLRRHEDWRRWEWSLPLLVLAAGAGVPLIWAIPLALGMGTLFALHLALLVYRLRALRRWFRLELPVVLVFAVMGMTIGIAGVWAPFGLGWAAYALTYAWMIAIGFFGVLWLLLAVPDIANKTQEAVAQSYAQSTLGRVDVQAKLAELTRLFEVERIHRDEGLSLARVAELMALSTHQLSELVNAHLGIGFSKLVRQHRVRDAQRMLVEEPRASVLSVGLAVGFASQSTFYVAFKDELGVVPGQYRKQALGSSAE